MTFAVHHDAAIGRFHADVDGRSAGLDYRLDGLVMSIVHTGVPDEIGGRGIAAALTRAALDHARRSGWKVRPRCTYAAAFMRRHPEYTDLYAP